MKYIGSRTRIIEPLIFILFAILPLLFLGTGTIADSLTNLQISPQGLLYDRYFNWDPNQLGAPTDFGTSYLIIGAFYLAMSWALPLWLVERLFFFLILFTSGYSLFLLAKEYRISRPSALVAGLFFMFSFFLTIFFKGSSVLVLAYAFCPLLLFLTIRGLRAKDSRYALLIGLLTCLFAGINPPEAILALTPSAVYAAYCLVANRDRFVLKFAVIVLIIGALVNLFWIVPGITNQLSVFGQGVWEETPSMHNQFSSYPEVVRGLGYWGLYDGWNGVPYYKWAAYFIESPVGVVLSFIVPFCAFAALLSRRAREPRFILIMIMMAVSIPLAVGAYPPSDPGVTGKLYLWLYDNVPLFDAFRSSYKFGIVMTLCYALLFGLFLDTLSDKLPAFLAKRSNLMKGRRNLVKVLIIALAVMTVMTAYWPAWTGQIVNKEAEFKVPAYYDEARAYFDERPDQRIMLTPGRYYSEYEWGHIAVEVMDIVLDNPIVYQNPGDASSSMPGIGLVNFLYTSLYLNDTHAVPLMMRYLGISYIVQQNDIDYEFYGARSPDEMRDILISIPGLEHVATFGKLDIYYLNGSSGGLDMVEARASVRSSDLAPGIGIDRLFVNKALMETRGNITNWTDGSSIYTRPLVGDFNVTAEVSISAGEKIGMALFFGEDDYYTFELSSNPANASGIGHYSRENLTSFDPHPYLCEYDTVQNVSLRNRGGTVDFEVNGQFLGSVNITGSATAEGPEVAFAAINALGKMDWIIIEDRTMTIRDDFTINVCPELRNWNTIGDWVIGTALTQFYDYDGEVPAFLYSSSTMAGQLAGTALVEPENVSYDLVDPTVMDIQVTGSSGPFVLVLKNQFADWKLAIDGEELAGSPHFLVDGYANGWLINRTGNFTIHATYAPQGNFEMGMIISIMALAGVILLMAASLVAPWMRESRAKDRRD